MAPCKSGAELLPNPQTRDFTLSLIHKAYQKALCKANNILEITDYFYKFLAEIQKTIPQEDKKFFYKFMTGIKTCYRERLRTFQVTNFMTYLSILVCYIIAWINTTPDALVMCLPPGMFDFENGFKFDYDICCILRRKALESELFKILKRALRNDHYERNIHYYHVIDEMSANIRDRWGFLCIIQNDFPEEDEAKYIDVIRMCLIDIMCEQNLELRTEFINWLRGISADNFDCDICERLLQKCSFSAGHFKDYVRKPKGEYQTQQWTYSVDHSSQSYGGLDFEAQIRTYRMHKKAVEADSDSSHLKHKTRFDFPEFAGLNIKKLQAVISVDDFIPLHIKGFTGYPAKISGSSDNNVDYHEVTNDKDIDGISLPKVICQRRVSRSLVILEYQAA